MKTIETLMSPRRSTRNLSINILVTLALALVFTLINHNFINKYNILSIGQNLGPYAMLALGVLMPISTGGIDLSVGALCIGSAVFAGTLYSYGMPLWATIPVMLAFGTLIGFINGLLIAKKNIPPFIATLGMMMFVRGATALFAPSPNILYPTGCWYNNVFSSYKGFPISFIWVILFAFILFFIYRKTKLGRYLVSIGNCEKATRISGVDVDKYKIIGYIGSGFMAGVAAVLWTASFSTVAIATGNGMELDAIAGVYIGGTSAAGGLANVFGSVIGSIMLVVIRSGLNFALAKLNIPINSTFLTYVISGIIVVVAVFAEVSKGTGKIRKPLNLKKQAVKRFIAYILSILILISLIAMNIVFDKGDSGSKSSSEVKTISLAMKCQGNDYWDELEKGANDAAAEFGYNVICRGTEGEDTSFLPKAREIVSTLLSDNPAGFGISTIANGFTDLIQEAYDRGIPVVEYDNGLQAEDYETVVNSDSNPLYSHVVASNYANGFLGGEMAFKAVREDIISNDGIYTVGIIQYSTINAAAERANGFKDGFESLANADSETSGKYEIIIETKPSDANNAYKEALEFLYEKNAYLIFASNLYVVNQVADAVNSAGGKYDGVKFVGFDGGEKPYEWLKSDSKSPLIGIVTQNPYMIGYMAVKTLIDIDNGIEVEKTIVIPGEWVTADTLN